MDTGTRQREQILFQYSQALERGDFEQVAAVLKMAEEDPVLERAICEINTAQAAWLGIESSRGREDSFFTKAVSQPGEMPPGDRPRRAEPGQDRWWTRLQTNLHRLGQWRFLPQTAAGLAVFFLIVTIALSSNDSQSPNGQNLVANTSLQSGDYLVSESGLGPSGLGQTRSSSLTMQNGYLSLIASDLTRMRQEIEALIATMAPEGAAVLSSTENFFQDSASPNLRLEVRVPSNDYEDTMRRLMEMAERVLVRTDQSEDPDGQNLSKELVSIQTRIDQLSASRQRLMDMIERASTTEEQLMAEKELALREADLKDLEARRDLIIHATDFSKISIDIRTTRPSPVAWNPQETVQEALHRLSNTGRSLVDGAITFAITILPWALPIAAVLYSMRRAFSRHREE